MVFKLAVYLILGVNITLLNGERVSLRELATKLKFSVRTTDKFSIVIETPYATVQWSSLYPLLVSTRSGKVFTLPEPPVRSSDGDLLFPREFLDFLFAQGEKREIKLVKPTSEVEKRSDNTKSAESQREKDSSVSQDKESGKTGSGSPEIAQSKEKKIGVAPIKTIIVDPGHGGKDPGAIGWKKHKEKAVVLSIGKLVAQKLRKKLKGKGIKVVLTRNSDVFISLEGRVKKANSFLSENSQAVFVSVHANASISRKRRGVETYYLSKKATDQEARAVAVAENAVFEEEVKSGKFGELNKVIGSLLQEELQRESKMMANLIQKELAAMTSGKLKNRGVKGAMFYVLKWVSMPSVLVEVGFITNPSDAKYLLSKEGQDRIAEGISRGIVQFIELYTRTEGFTK